MSNAGSDVSDVPVASEDYDAMKAGNAALLVELEGVCKSIPTDNEELLLEDMQLWAVKWDEIVVCHLFDFSVRRCNLTSVGTIFACSPRYESAIYRRYPTPLHTSQGFPRVQEDARRLEDSLGAG